MFEIDLSNDDYYIIYRDNKEFVRINRSKNSLFDIIKYFKINKIKGGEVIEINRA